MGFGPQGQSCKDEWSNSSLHGLAARSTHDTALEEVADRRRELHFVVIVVNVKERRHETVNIVDR